MEIAKSLDEFYASQTEWRSELELLRNLLLSTGLSEDLKWGAPAFLYKGKNLIGIGAFKNYVGLWFHQGVFLKDEKRVLVNAQEGKTKALRQWRFNSIEEMDEDLIKSYVFEAIDNHLAGKEIKPVRQKTFTIPPELQNELNHNGAFKAAFYDLTWGKQKEYAQYISDAKQEKTKLTRMKKIVPMVFDKVGLHDKYKPSK